MSGKRLAGVQCGSSHHLILKCPRRFERRDVPHGVREAHGNGCGAKSAQVKNVSAKAPPRMCYCEEVKAEAAQEIRRQLSPAEMELIRHVSRTMRQGAPSHLPSGSTVERSRWLKSVVGPEGPSMGRS